MHESVLGSECISICHKEGGELREVRDHALNNRLVPLMGAGGEEMAMTIKMTS